MSAAIQPDPSEYAPYYGKYVTLVNQPVLEALEEQAGSTAALLSSLTEEQGNHRYGQDKWTIKEVIGHLADTERIFAYRALRISRGDATPIEGFDQDGYVRMGGFNSLALTSVAADFSAVRSSTLTLFRSLSEDAWARRGTANKNEVSVRALAFIAAGHELHHIDILKKKYL
jgi:hypothetical protein